MMPVNSSSHRTCSVSTSACLSSNNVASTLATTTASTTTTSTADLCSSAEQFRKIFIGGLSVRTDTVQLRNYFSQWGQLVDVVVMHDRKSGRSRGFGFVTFDNHHSVDLVQADRPHEIDGKTVETKRAMAREDANNPEAHLTVNRLFVGGLNRDIASNDLEQFFQSYGNILQSEIVRWKETGESRCFGFVTFDDYDPVDKAVLWKHHTIHGCAVDVKKALSREQINALKRESVKTSSNVVGTTNTITNANTNIFTTTNATHTNTITNTNTTIPTPTLTMYTGKNKDWEQSIYSSMPNYYLPSYAAYMNYLHCLSPHYWTPSMNGFACGAPTNSSLSYMIPANENVPTGVVAQTNG